jgi:hypothetical protein
VKTFASKGMLIQTYYNDILWLWKKQIKKVLLVCCL